MLLHEAHLVGRCPVLVTLLNFNWRACLARLVAQILVELIVLGMGCVEVTTLKNLDV